MAALTPNDHFQSFFETAQCWIKHFPCNFLECCCNFSFQAVNIFTIFDINLPFMNPHRKKFMGVRSGDLAGQGMFLSSTPPLPIQRRCRLEFSQSRTRFSQSSPSWIWFHGGYSKARFISKIMIILTAWNLQLQQHSWKFHEKWLIQHSAVLKNDWKRVIECLGRHVEK